MAIGQVRRILCVIALVGASVLAPIRAGADEVLVFAAASLKTALDDIVADYERQSGQKVTVSYAASSVLARQIQQGAPTDVFISANLDWMDVLEKQKRIDPATRKDLLGNELVLIGSTHREQVGQIGPGYDLAAELDGGFLAMALVDAVPAGIYAKAALERLGQWQAIRPRVAQSDNVRAALALVATGAAPLGIVYKTDAQAEPRVRIVGTIPSDLHPPIIYPAALTTTANSAAIAFMDHLQSETAQTVFLGQGFSLPDG